MTNENSQLMPVLFIGHGNPMNAIEENEFVKEWRRLGDVLPKPKAILCISAHWETRGTYVTAVSKPRTIHDFGGFPKELYMVQYPAPGSPEVAYEVSNNIPGKKIGMDEKWGLDHGAWSVLKHLYPKADTPVLELSLDYNKSPQDHYTLAKELSILREEGVLIIGSGNMVHNLGLAAWDHPHDTEYGFDWALHASQNFIRLILDNDHKGLINYASLGREAKLAVPTPEHFLPLIYTLALKKENETISVFNNKTIMGSLSMASLLIG